MRKHRTPLANHFPHHISRPIWHSLLKFGLLLLTYYTTIIIMIIIIIIIKCATLFLCAAPRKLCHAQVESTTQAKSATCWGDNHVAIARVRTLGPGRHTLASRSFVLAARDVSSCGDQCDFEAAALLGAAHEQEVHELPHPLLQISECLVAPPMLGVETNSEFEHYNVFESHEPAAKTAQACSDRIIERCRCRRSCQVRHVAQKRPSDSALLWCINRMPRECSNQACNSGVLLLRSRPAMRLQGDGWQQSIPRACSRTALTSAPRTLRR